MQELLQTDRDYLEMLMHKISVMRQCAKMYYSNKSMKTNEHMYNAAKADLAEFYTLLRKRGYDPTRYAKPSPSQPNLFS